MDLDAFIRLFEKTLDLEHGRIGGGTRLAEVPSFDSMGRLSFIVMADEELGVIVEAGDLNRCLTIADLHAMLVEKRGSL